LHASSFPVARVKLIQLRSLVEVARNDLNVTRAAAAMRVHQSVISRQVRALERHLGVELLVRNGKRVDGLTEPGESIVRVARRMLEDATNLSNIAGDYSGTSHGTLTVAATYTQARYALPPVIRRFSRRYPAVRLILRQGQPAHLAQLVRTGEADLCIGSVASTDRPGLATFDCYSMDLLVLTPPDHPLLEDGPLTLQALSRYPIITYAPHFAARAVLERAFAAASLVPTIASSAVDTDAIKAHVNGGPGVAVIAKVAYNPRRDQKLRAIDASHLFEPYTVHVGLRPNDGLRRYAYDFITLLAPHLTRNVVHSDGG
jgi:LysR family cys regulon transcriptional activator